MANSSAKIQLKKLMRSIITMLKNERKLLSFPNIIKVPS